MLIYAKTVLLIFSFTLPFNLAAANELKPFESDGCSLFPDTNILTKTDWCSCCFEHDVVYWRGGTKEERKNADIQLRRCILEKTENEVLAKAMYDGVRLGGSPYFYNWYRWGYGWKQRRAYSALTKKEQQAADSLLQKYYQQQKDSACPAARSFKSYFDLPAS